MIQIRAYGTDDAQNFLTLNRALLDYYKIAPATTDEETRLTDLLDAQRHLNCEIAYVDDMPSGFATWTLLFPAGAGLAMFMKELFVHPTYQGRGVGQALMAHLT